LFPTTERACLFCQAWRHWDRQAVSSDAGRTIRYEPTGQCRANPPTINRREVSSTNAEWPVVTASDWCMSFSPTGEIYETEVAA
ncbi:hypothetical protein, partial [Methylobacterium sp. Leaf85]|uniref:hypothetical protein n=1 Tax=Methylobacterium sp. Leaf85 TaxID=1736241 RepID=UPI0006F2E21C